MFWTWIPVMNLAFAFKIIFFTAISFILPSLSLYIIYKITALSNLIKTWVFYLENFLSSFGLASTSDKSTQSPSKSRILGSIYWSKSYFQSMSFIFVISFMFLFFSFYHFYSEINLTNIEIGILWNLFWKNPGKVLNRLVLQK